MRHTNLSSAVRQAKELAKAKKRPHYANGASGRYRVSDKKPEDSSFVQATPSGGEWSHKLNAATKTFTKSRFFGGVTMESVERDWCRGTMRELIEKLEGGMPDNAVSRNARVLKGAVDDAVRVVKAGDSVVAAQVFQEIISGVRWLSVSAFGDSPEGQKFDKAILNAQRVMYAVEKSLD